MIFGLFCFKTLITTNKKYIKQIFELKKRKGTILVMGTIKQFRELIDKLDRHYTRIKDISKDLSLILDDML